MCELLERYTVKLSYEPHKVMGGVAVYLKDEVDAELSQLRQLCREMHNTLRPFANFACSPAGQCDCNNCKARAAIEKYTKVMGS